VRKIYLGRLPGLKETFNMIPFPVKLRQEHEQWRKDNPDLAKKLDDEMDAVMTRVIKDSESKYGKQSQGVYRIDPDSFKNILREIKT